VKALFIPSEGDNSGRTKDIADLPTHKVGYQIARLESNDTAVTQGISQRRKAGKCRPT